MFTLAGGARSQHAPDDRAHREAARAAVTRSADRLAQGTARAKRHPEGIAPIAEPGRQWREAARIAVDARIDRNRSSV